MKANLERQLSLFPEGFWLINFYFLALLSKTIISQRALVPHSDWTKTGQHLVR